MSNFYTDEPIGWLPPDNLDDGDMDMPEGTDSIHNWDYFEPEPDDKADSWQSEYQNADTVSAPEKIRQLLEKIRRQPWQITMAKSFYEQAKFMVDYRDNAEIVPYMNYFPTYRDMSVGQLRSYFTIRKMWRQGKFPNVSLSYIFVYIYELLMQIGIDTPEEGYEILQELQAAYTPSEPKLNRYLVPWLKDYVVYYNLSEHFKEVFPEENKLDALATLLSDYANLDGKTLVDTVCFLSKYDIRKAALFKKNGENALEATSFVLKSLFPILEQENHHHIETLCFGKKVKRQVTMFSNAVFYTPEPVKTAEIAVAPRHHFYCRGGLWSKDVYMVNVAGVGKQLGIILHEIDCQLRPVFNVKPVLKSNNNAARYCGAIHEAICIYTEAKRKEEAVREAERKRVSIDFSKLGKIREDAEVVQEKLTVDDTPDSLDTLVPLDNQGTSENIEPLPHLEYQTNEGKASSNEAAFLHLFLSGDDWNKFLHENHIPEGVMIEKINEKAMDEIGDIVLEDNGDGLHLIEDYREDVERLLKLWETR